MVVTLSSERLTDQDLSRFVETGKSEDTTLDFKSEPYKLTDEGRKEFVKDVTAFANSQGGNIVIGVAEDEGVASRIQPITSLEIDKEILRLENLCRDSIEPGLIGIDIYSIAIDGGELIVVRVPKSWAAPHRANSRKSKLFYQRHSRSVSEMDVSQLRQAFLESSTAFEKAALLSGSWACKKEYEIVRTLEKLEDQEREQDGHMSSREEDDPSDRDGILLLHIIPVGSLMDRTNLPIQRLEGLDGYFKPIMAMGSSSQINLPGVRYYVAGSKYEYATQVHRFGGLEITAEKLIRQQDGGRELLGPKLSDELKDCLPRLLAGLRKLDVAPPLFVKLRILRVSNSTMDNGGRQGYWSHGEPVFQENNLDIPEVILTDFPADDEICSLGKQLLDPLWNAYGRARCPYFNEEGTWLNRQL